MASVGTIAVVVMKLVGAAPFTIIQASLVSTMAKVDGNVRLGSAARMPFAVVRLEALTNLTNAGFMCMP